jgi:hypothetical protein
MATGFKSDLDEHLNRFVFYWTFLLNNDKGKTAAGNFFLRQNSTVFS